MNGNLNSPSASQQMSWHHLHMCCTCEGDRGRVMVVAARPPHPAAAGGARRAGCQPASPGPLLPGRHCPPAAAAGISPPRSGQRPRCLCSPACHWVFSGTILGVRWVVGSSWARGDGEHSALPNSRHLLVLRIGSKTTAFKNEASAAKGKAKHTGFLLWKQDYCGALSHLPQFSHVFNPKTLLGRGGGDSQFGK